MGKIIRIILFFVFSYSIAQGQDVLSIKINPSKINIETGESWQFINCDFLIQNNTGDTLTLSKITVTVLDKNRKILLQKFLDDNGTAPSIQTIPNRVFNGKVSRLIFNPFEEFNIGLDLSNVEFQFTFSNNQNEKYSITTAIHPEKYIQKVNYVFPLKGKILVYDGHDYYAHHRRFDYNFEPIKQLGITNNFMRYAYDFVILDSANNQYTGNSENELNYAGFGKTVYAGAEGKVIYASNKHKDDRSFDIPEIAKNPLELYGNCIAIQHNDGNISIYGHLKQNSIKVKIGDMAKSQQEIASIGLSGSSFFPHLHFEVRTSITNSADGIPSYFSNVYLSVTGRKIGSGLLETGSIITAR